MFCSYCGAEMGENTYLCKRCGARAEQTFQRGKMVHAAFVIATAAIFLLLGIGLGLAGGIVWQKKSNKLSPADSLAAAVLVSGADTPPVITPENGQNQFPEKDPAQATGNVYDANLSALAAESRNYASQVLQYWKTPASQGGAGENIKAVNTYDISMYLGFTDENPPKSTETDSGTYIVDSVSGGIVTLKGIGRIKKNGLYPLITSRVELSSGVITSQPGMSAGL